MATQGQGWYQETYSPEFLNAALTSAAASAMFSAETT